MIFGWALSCSWDKGDLVVRSDIGEALWHKAGEIIDEIKGSTAALDGEHLQRQVPQVHLVGLGDGLQEYLILRAPKLRLGCAQGINLVKRDARLGQSIRHIHNIREDLLLLF